MKNYTPYTVTSQRKSINSSNLTNWKDKLKNKSGNPDKKLIALAELITYWYKPQKVIDPITGEKKFISKFHGDIWQTSYAYLYKKLNCSKDTIRRKLVILEKLGFTGRIFETIIVKGQEYNNRLFIDISNNFFKLATGFNKISYQEKVNNFDQKNNLPSPKKKRSLYIDIYNIKYRSIKSSFIKNNSKEKNQDDEDRNQNNTGNRNNKIDNENIRPKNLPKPRQLDDFYPLSQEDAKELIATSGREFSLNAINEILKSMARRLKDRFFRSKAAFLTYMSKALRYEMRDAVKISNEGFKIRSNEDEKERKAREEEKYLEEMEYNLQVSPEWHLKKKLCSVLERKQAYNLLKAYRFSQVEGNKFKIHLNKRVSLSEQEKEIILKQAKATHERANLGGETNEIITSLEVIMPEEGSNQSALCTNSSIPEFIGIWGKIRKSLISHCRDQGEALDRNWFSKLEAEVDEEKKAIKLKAPSKFFKDWIRDRYGYLLISIIGEYEYTYEMY